MRTSKASFILIPQLTQNLLSFEKPKIIVQWFHQHRF